MSEMLLKVEDLNVYYGMIRALKGISFHVNEGEIVSLIGANGAGKTTTLHTITGLIHPKKGKVFYKGEDITQIPAHKIVYKGMVHVPEGRRIFQNLTVYDNLLLGAYSRKDKAEIARNMELVFTQFPRLAERRTQLAGTLSGGEQQMLAMGRALLSAPSLIVLDELVKTVVLLISFRVLHFKLLQLQIILTFFAYFGYTGNAELKRIFFRIVIRAKLATKPHSVEIYDMRIPGKFVYKLAVSPVKIVIAHRKVA